ncbi:MAG TPA: hypothetical protein VFW29_01700 [Solirubrobacteraceae bacterium]|nr:hypothetical protein [Solirubrobacteraceae bacterium]
MTKDPGIERAAERLTLACRALTAAANDLAIAKRRDGAPVDDAAHELEVELERICALAEQLERRVTGLGVLAPR